MDQSPTEDPGARFQAAAMAHLDRVWEAFYAQEDADDGVEIDNPAVGPFCGCEVCVVRELLAGAWPLIEAYFAEKATAQIPIQPASPS